jgi:hypothetical protein
MGDESEGIEEIRKTGKAKKGVSLLLKNDFAGIQTSR